MIWYFNKRSLHGSEYSQKKIAGVNNFQIIIKSAWVNFCGSSYHLKKFLKIYVFPIIAFLELFLALQTISDKKW